MKDYRIEYQDKEQNELFISIVNAVDLEDATDFANKLMDATKLNDLYTFIITEI
jgi:deoxyinosine 3'endonuclease (endonuclease V)